MALIQLIYVSSAIDEQTDIELDRILDSSVRHNAPQSVTGLLIYANGNYIQVIEGEESAIDETYDRICKDPRHRNIFLLSREPISEREFPSWTMSFRKFSTSDAKAHPAYAPLFVRGYDVQQIGAHPGLATAILRQFCKG